MTEHCLWRFSRALHRAINERQPADLEALLDEDVDWAIYGPIDMYSFFGSRRGKAAVIDVIRQIADNFRVHRFDRESIMLGMDSAASMMRYSLTALDTNKPISLRIAHFAQFRAGRLTNFRVLVDTFDLVEQTVGYPITCRGWPGSSPPYDSNRHARARELHLRVRASTSSFASPKGVWMAGSPGATTRCARP